MKNIQKKQYYLLKNTKIKESPVSDILQHITSLFLNILNKVICKDDIYNGFQEVRKNIFNQGWNFSFSRTLLPSCSYNILLCFSCHRWRGFSQGRGDLQHCYTTLTFLKCCSCPLEIWITPRDFSSGHSQYWCCELYPKKPCKDTRQAHSQSSDTRL